MNLTALPVSTLREGLRQRRWCVREIVDAQLAEIARVEPSVKAFLHLAEASLRDAAGALDARLERPHAIDALPLAGAVVAVKDAFCTRAMPTTCGSKMLEGYRAPYDATAVERLEAAGALLVGKTNMDEFAMGSSTEHSAYFATRNPYDLTRTPGGSSGGSAAAVAARMAPVALGSDTGGSVRQPAALTGVVGFKPGYGRISRYGLVAFASSLDVVAPFARTVDDVHSVYIALAGRDGRDPTAVEAPVEGGALVAAPLRGLRVGVPREYLGPGVEAAVGDAVAASLALMRAAGAEVIDLSMPHTALAGPCYYVLAPAEASSNLARFDGVRYGLRAPARELLGMYGATRDAGFGDEVKRRILIGTFVLSAGYVDAYYAQAQRARALIADDFVRAFARCDVLVTPTSPTTAFALGARHHDPVAMYQADLCTLPASLAGVPAISLPVGLDGAGLPVGLQLIGPRLGERRLLEIAAAVESLHRQLPPPTL
ncbi:MAG: Asp-tRNA(Asn)/Glu-tRNA(Gln) amidotransferase subunit GatA [Myxococcales bacterium]|nr:Asp-tRNA(Asn)/Glu-tRNA(Gln) amidotransferase subunit GatA [Myxococcales bacterium]